MMDSVPDTLVPPWLLDLSLLLVSMLNLKFSCIQSRRNVCLVVYFWVFLLLAALTQHLIYRTWATCWKQSINPVTLVSIRSKTDVTIKYFVDSQSSRTWRKKDKETRHLFCHQKLLNCNIKWHICHVQKVRNKSDFQSILPVMWT